MPASNHFPRVSVIMPTLNTEAILERCLSSIARQTYPQDKIEIILADAHSTDRTREIGKKFGALILDDNGKNMEEGKRLALRHASGDYILFVDADNEITHEDYLELAVTALAQNPQALGVEGYYPPSPEMSSFGNYLTHRLHISDPICWLMSSNPRLVARDGETERWILPEGTYSYPLGANGFVYRRADLQSVQANEKFQDTHVALFLMKAGKREWLRIRGRGVHHFYVQTWWGFVKKRRRATVHFLRVQEEMPVNWMKEKPPIPLWLAALYCVTFLGPIYHTLLGLVRDRDARWLWHIPACLASVLGDVWGVLTYRQRGKQKSLIAELQVNEPTTNGGKVGNIWRSGILYSAANFVVGLGNFAYQAIIGNKLDQTGDYGFVNSTISLIALMTTPVSIAIQAITYYIARYNYHGDTARLHGLLSGCQKFLFRFTLIGSLAAVLLVQPLCVVFKFPAGLAEVALACVLLQFWGGLATALCQGMSWFRRLAIIALLGMCLRLLFAWVVVTWSPKVEWAVLATGVAFLSNLLVFFWKDEIIRHEKPVNPWNRELLGFFVVCGACIISNYLFLQGDGLVAQRYFSNNKPMLDAYTGASIFTRALVITVGPLLAVLFTHRSTANSGQELKEQLKVMGLYAAGLGLGLLGLLLLRDYCLKFTHKYSPEAADFVLRLSVPMVFVGLMQAIAMWALASRWLKIAVLYGCLGGLYWLVLFLFGKTPETLPKVMTLYTAAAFVVLFATWLQAMRHGRQPSETAPAQ